MFKTLSEQIDVNFGFKLTGPWTELPLSVVEQASEDFCQAFHLLPPLHLGWLSGLEIRSDEIPFAGLTSHNLIRLNPTSLNNWTVVHELAHAWDRANWFILSFRMMLATRSWGPVPFLHAWQPNEKRFWYRAGSPPPPCGIDQNFNRVEDFAEAVTAYVYPKEAFQRAVASGYAYGHYGYLHFRQTPRGNFIARLADLLKKEEKKDAHKVSV